MKLPSLSSLRFFDTAARHTSFIRAAEELHVTHGAVSRQIRQLEDDLGVVLFERRNRAVFLTPAGKTLFVTTGQIFHQLQQTTEMLRHQPQEQVVSFSCEPTIAMRWLIPRLNDFYQQHPDVTVQLVTAGGMIDFRKTSADLALRRNDFKWHHDIYAAELCPEWIGRVQHADLQDAPAACRIVPATRPDVWQTWLARRDDADNPPRAVSYEHFYMCIQAALAGQGATVASFLMVTDELTSGQLTAPGGFVSDDTAYYLLSPEAPAAGSAAARFSAWLAAQVRESRILLNIGDSAAE